MSTKTALVTGAGSGIGAAIARQLAAGGARVIVADIEAADVVANQIGALGGIAEATALDVTDADAVRELVDDVATTYGLDTLINNAGIAVGGETDSLADDDWDRVLSVNLGGVVHGVRAAYPHMKKRRAGHIVNIASVAGLAPYPLTLPYTTSKHAVVGMSLALRAEAAQHNVRVSVACPGAIKTPIWQRSPIRGGWDETRLRALLNPRTTADECAAAILRGTRKNRAVIPVTLEARAAWAIHRVSPQLSGWLGDQMCKRLLRLAERRG